MYLDDLEGELKGAYEDGEECDFPLLLDLPVCCLMYADDLTLVATSGAAYSGKCT